VNNRLHILALLVILGALAHAQTFTTLYKFDGGTGAWPYAGVVQDSKGNLYGATDGGSNVYCFGGVGCGLIFKLDKSGQETVLYSFSGSGPEGGTPMAPVLLNEAGSLFGTTQYGGGSRNCPSFDGCGTVFEINAAGKQTVLHSFTGRTDGCYPTQGLIQDSAGNLYGTTYGCAPSRGTVFKMNAAGNFTVLHTFTGGSADGAGPMFGHLTMDNSGNIYGVTTGGGASDAGVVYKVSETGEFKVLHSFAAGADGCEPLGSVAWASGKLYGTTAGCGTHNDGTIWEISTDGEESPVHQFAGGTSDGCGPAGGVALDANGDLYGVTTLCGADNHGALYELSGSGKLTLLYSFDSPGGYEPYGEVMRTTEGMLYGTTLYGGTGPCEGSHCGTVWSYAP
jgi:uncharacterized repeat protein (TIGR03803 family)